MTAATTTTIMLTMTITTTKRTAMKKENESYGDEVPDEEAEVQEVAFVAIGATMVGSITFTKKKGDHVRKGDEDSIKIDKDLLENSARSLETLVAVGMTLGVSKKKHPEVGLPNLDKCVLQA